MSGKWAKSRKLALPHFRDCPLFPRTHLGRKEENLIRFHAFSIVSHCLTWLSFLSNMQSFLKELKTNESFFVQLWEKIINSN